MSIREIRNIAIIAHVDHGKTTLVDGLLRQSNTFQAHQEIATCVMDSGDLEKERGITILAKCTAVHYKDYKINIVDTPGHADFGGEVERILSMVDGVVLLVDAAEGPMPQTKFVLSKALKLGLRPIVLINKIDRQDERHEEVLNEIFDLFCSLDATEEQLDFPVLYASGRNGWCVTELTDPRESLTPLFDKVISHVPTPNVDQNAPFATLATLLSVDKFFGRTLTGKIYSGVAKANMTVKAIGLDGKKIEDFRLTKLFTHLGVQKIPADEVIAGDIVVIAGMTKATVADTICDVSIVEPIKSTPIDPPTMSITISVNDSPLAGTEGDKVTSRMIRDRLYREAETNVAIKVRDSGGSGESFDVAGRGELQLGVLVETMRREGFELSVSRPRVLFKRNEKKEILEPIEEITIDVDDEFSGVVIEKLNIRKGEMQDMRQSGHGKTRIIYHMPSRGLIGYYGQFLTDTRGTGIMNRMFNRYDNHRGPIESRKTGTLISTETGDAVAYALWKIEERGIIFVNVGDKLYTGMIIGENAKEGDMEVNPIKGKQLTNVRSSGTDEAVKLTPPKILTLEDMMAYIGDDELVEVTPKSIRLRKKYLVSTDRKRFSRSSTLDGMFLDE